MSLGEILSTLLLGPLKLLFEFIFCIAYRATNSSGISIIILSLMVNLLLMPLYKRADVMQEEARETEEKLRDTVSHIKRTFSGDERMMILQTYYRQNNYRPTDALNGSISLLLQIPFFMAAYQFLSGLSLFEGATFGPIMDLSAQDGLLKIAGVSVNVLPVLMTLINVVSGAIYAKDAPLKSKIQLYAMAAFFLVFLYNSPAGLVLYWSLNNLFSLGKNLFNKLAPSRETVIAGISLLGLVVISYFAFVFTGSVKLRIMMAIIGLALQSPAAIWFLEKKIHCSLPKVTGTPSKKTFILGGLFLTTLTGILIPSTYIASSTQEFVYLTYYHNPLWFCVASTCLASGTFLVWMSVFYALSDNVGKVFFEKMLWILCGVMIVDYMFFGTNLGVVLSNLQYELGMDFTLREMLINIVVLLAVVVLMYLFTKKQGKYVPAVLLMATIALGSMSALNIVTIQRDLKDLDDLREKQNNAAPQFELSTEGDNVVVIMLDRAMGVYIPYMFNEKPELARQFDGFTNYTNVLAFGGATNFASPALFGGYEYTPVELNKRSEETLAAKQNEALKVMPVLFMENDFKVTVCDPIYANYNWLSDVSIYDEYSGIDAYVTKGEFDGIEHKKTVIENNHRNFFVFSIMKTMPLMIQPTIYNLGEYNQIGGSPYSGQVCYSISVAEGVRQMFMESFVVLQNLTEMTRISQDSTNTYMSLVNKTTHDPIMLQAPEYLPAEYVDNTAYDTLHADRFTVDGKTLKIDEEEMTYYHTHMASFMQLGKWFDYLRENGVYDNTRIILVSDHGWASDHFDELYIDDETGVIHNMESYHPLLMVKDFNSTGLTKSDEFMTNADVPVLAMKGLIEEPLNPFTGKRITSDEKTAHDQLVILSNEHNVAKNNGTTFLPSGWASVKEDIWTRNNWSFCNENTVLTEHKLP